MQLDFDLCLRIVQVVCLAIYFFFDIRTDRKLKAQIEDLQKQVHQLEHPAVMVISRSFYERNKEKIDKWIKPPLGIIPKYLWLEMLDVPFVPTFEELVQRQRDLIKTVERYRVAGWMPDLDWYIEITDLQIRLYDRRYRHARGE